MALTLAMAALIGSIVSGIAAAGTNIYSANAAKQAQESANATNIELTKQANEAQLQQVRETNEFNAAQAQIERDRQDTQAQRMMADYSAAGLNPLLAANAYGGGNYASPVTAQGNVAQVQRSKVEPAALDFSGMASAFSSMSNAMLVNAMLSKNAQNKAEIASLNRASRESIAKARMASAEGIARANRRAGYQSIYYDKYGEVAGQRISRGL